MPLSPPPIQQGLNGGGHIHRIWAEWLTQFFRYVGDLPTSGGGSSTLTITSVSAVYAMADTDRVLLCNTGAGGFTVTLPTAAAGNGLIYYVKKRSSDANIVTIQGSGGELIDGAASATIFGAYEAIRLISDGTTWLSL